MKWIKVFLAGSFVSLLLALIHFLIGVEVKVYAQERTGLLKRVVRVGLPFWESELVVFSASEEFIETPYSKYLRQRLSSFENLSKEGEWILASASINGLLYSDKRKFVSASGFEIFPLPWIREQKVYDFLIAATSRHKITPQEVSKLITEHKTRVLETQEAFELEYARWAGNAKGLSAQDTNDD